MNTTNLLAHQDAIAEKFSEVCPDGHKGEWEVHDKGDGVRFLAPVGEEPYIPARFVVSDIHGKGFVMSAEGAGIVATRLFLEERMGELKGAEQDQAIAEFRRLVSYSATTADANAIFHVLD